MGLDRAGTVDGGRIHFHETFRMPARLDREGRAAQIADGVLDGLACGEAVGQRDRRPSAGAENQQIGLGIRQHRTFDLLGPVIVMGDAAQAGLMLRR